MANDIPAQSNIIPYGKWLINDSEERYEEGDQRRWSLLMFVVGGVLYVLRRLSLQCHLVRIIPGIHPMSRTPAWFVDLYMIAWWILISVLLISSEVSLKGSILRWWPLFISLQVTQSNFYLEFWRTRKFKDDQIMGRVHSRLRNLIWGFLTFIYVTLLFALAYKWSGSEAFHNSPKTTIDYIYFSFVTASTLGYGDIYPLISSDGLQLLVIAQILSTLFVLAVILSQSVSAIGALKEHQIPGAPRNITVVCAELRDRLSELETLIK